MKKTLNNYGFLRNQLLIRSAFVLSSIMLFAYNSFSQSDPGIGNLNKNLNAAKEQMSKEEKMNYVWMAAGFILVMTIAWVSTSMAKKRKLAQEELVRRRHLQHSAKHPSHDPYFKAHGHAAKVKK